MTELRPAARVVDGDGPFHTTPETDREEINRVRQAAEALFAPKRALSEPADSVPSPSLGDQTPRKPRFLRALGVQPTPVEPIEATAERKPATPPQKIISASHLARIRTWLRYGMTARQAAKMYGVSVSEIERILQET